MEKILSNSILNALAWFGLGVLIYENTWGHIAVYGIGFFCGVMGGILLVLSIKKSVELPFESVSRFKREEKELRSLAEAMIQELKGTGIVWDEFGLLCAAWRSRNPDGYFSRVEDNKRSEMLKRCWAGWEWMALEVQCEKEKTLLKGYLREIGGKSFVLS